MCLHGSTACISTYIHFQCLMAFTCNWILSGPEFISASVIHLYTHYTPGYTVVSQKSTRFQKSTHHSTFDSISRVELHLIEHPSVSQDSITHGRVSFGSSVQKWQKTQQCSTSFAYD